MAVVLCTDSTARSGRRRWKSNGNMETASWKPSSFPSLC